MAHIKLEIEVKNPDEVIANHKGRWMGLVTVFMKKEKKKAIVEKTIYEEVLEKLKNELDEKLLEEGVKAEISLTIEGIEKMER